VLRPAPAQQHLQHNKTWLAHRVDAVLAIGSTPSWFALHADAILVRPLHALGFPALNFCRLAGSPSCPSSQRLAPPTAAPSSPLSPLPCTPSQHVRAHPSPQAPYLACIVHVHPLRPLAVLVSESVPSPIVLSACGAPTAAVCSLALHNGSKASDKRADHRFENRRVTSGEGEDDPVCRLGAR
jgi:hypothetical protein